MTAFESRDRGGDVAIIGMAGRFPGAASVAEFWRNVCGGVEALSTFSDDELIAAGIDPAQLADPAYVKRGFVLADIASFDASFFGIARREAELTDPQRRLFLECAWEAFEDAGYDPHTFAGRVGVYAGASLSTYLLHNLSPALAAGTSVDSFQALVSNDKDYLATYVSYQLNLRGPSVGIQSACSTSLVAVHLAAQSLLNGECDLALAGGVTIRVPQTAGYRYEKEALFSPDGHSRAFDAKAQGTAFGSGLGIVILKRFADAVADGDCIDAVIRGSAVNNDGSRKVGFIAPSVDGQAAVITEALAVAGVDPTTIGYIETHGTGTMLGDGIEVAALHEVFRKPGAAPQSCAIGSVKTNVGHLECAAGVAGLIKAVAALKHGKLPPSLHFEQPNPHIDLAGSPLYVNTRLHEWPQGAAPRRAGVSSFGIGGTNAHVVLEEALPAPPSSRDTGEAGPARLLPLSAQNEAALRALIRQYQTLLSADDAPALRDVCFSASVRRRHHAHRFAAIVRSRGEAVTQLETALSSSSGLARVALNETRRGIVFVFAGQGSQWLGMGRELMCEEPLFRQSLESSDRAIRQLVQWSVLEELSADAERSHLDDVDVVQPTLFALQVALAALWRSWGIEPDAVVGHSMGEVAAAHVAGSLTLEEAARVICLRSRLLRQVRGRGAMAVVELSQAEAGEALVGYMDRVAVAASNGPRSTVLSGDPDALTAVITALERKGVFCRWIKVDVASHSPQVDPLLPELRQALRDLNPRTAAPKIYSTVVGAPLEGRELDAAYWARNLREPVLLAGTVQRLMDDGNADFVEISPHPLLTVAIEECLRAHNTPGMAMPSLRRAQPERETMLETLGGLYASGHAVNWRAVAPTDGRYVRLPSYPWQRERYWVAAASDGHGIRWGRFATHPLLGQRLPLADGGHVWQTMLSAGRPPYLTDHRVNGLPLLPSTAYAEMAVAAAHEVLGSDALVLKDVEYRLPLVLPDAGASLAVQIVLIPAGDSAMSFKVFSRPDAPDASWTLHATGIVRVPREAASSSAAVDLEEIQRRCGERVSGDEFYRAQRAQGMHWGPTFQGIAAIWRRNGEALGQVRLASALEPGLSAYHFHPAFSDACSQVLAATLDVPRGFVTAGVREVRLHRRAGGGLLWSHARVGSAGDRDDPSVLEGDVRVFDEGGQLVAEMLGVRFWYLTGEAALAGMARAENWLYRLEWRVQPRRQAATRSSTRGRGPWLIFADRHGVGTALAAALRAAGEPVRVVVGGPEFARVDREQWQIRPGEVQDLSRLVEEFGSESGACRGVVHLWSLDTAESPVHTTTALEASQILSCGSVATLVQALLGSNWEERPRVRLVTRGAQPVVAKTGIALAQAPLWGLGRAMAQEQPDLWGALIDLDPDASIDDAAAALCAELLEPDGEDQVALRQGARYTARLIPARTSPAPESSVHWRRDASYLVTGGLGGIGLEVARWMIQQGARRLVLLGRTDLPPRAEWGSVAAGHPLSQRIAAVRELEALGAAVHVGCADVGDAETLRGVLDAFRREGWPPIRGVIHAAGVTRYRPLDAEDTSGMLEVLHPKMSGAWGLHELLKDEPLDFFVMFSSGASLLSSPLMGAYAAANAFLDALANFRTAAGQPALAINWGPWSKVGMVARAEAEAGNRPLLKGWGTIEPSVGVELLGQLMRQGCSQIAVLPIDWQQWRLSYPSFVASPLFSEVLAGASDLRLADTGTLTRDAVLAAPAPERQRLVHSYLTSLVSRALRLTGEPVEWNRNLRSLGLDSLAAIQLRNRVEADLGVNLPMVKFLANGDITQVAEAILDQLTDLERVLAEVEVLSDAEAEERVGIAPPAEEPATLVHVIRRRAGQHPERRAYVFLPDGEREGASLTYDELDRAARALAAMLQRHDVEGQRVILLYPPGPDFLKAFLGCLYAGAVAVPAIAPHPAKLNKALPRLAAIAENADPVVVATTRDLLTVAAAVSARHPSLTTARWLATDDVADTLADEWREPGLTRDSLAHFQYTSGSTGTPRGVMVTHGNLMHNERLIQQATGYREAATWVGWAPHYHDMGLVGDILQPLYTGGLGVCIPPLAFVRRPLCWLEAISRYKGIVSGAPNFGYELCAQRLRSEQVAGLDLSGWEVAFVSAEPVRYETLRRFAAALGPAGFSWESFFPCYGLAESTLLVTASPRRQPPLVKTFDAAALEQRRAVAPDPSGGTATRTLVASGYPVLDQDVRIVDPDTRAGCADGSIGEVWVASASVARGYWSRPDETARDFHASLAEPGEGPFLRTGDLGFISDRQLFVVGRLKDLIIIDGQNHSPEDIELTAAQSHGAIRPGGCAAFSVDVADRERLIILAEVDSHGLDAAGQSTELDGERQANEAAQQIIACIRERVAEEHGIRAHVICLVGARSIPKTTSGKLQRFACRDAFLAQTLTLVASSQPGVTVQK